MKLHRNNNPQVMDSNPIALYIMVPVLNIKLCLSHFINISSTIKQSSLSALLSLLPFPVKNSRNYFAAALFGKVGRLTNTYC